MPHIPPINRQDLLRNKNKDVVSEKRFYELVSQQMNYVDSKLIKKVYLSMVKAIVAEIRRNGMVRLPHLGDMALVRMKDKIGWAGSHQEMMKNIHMLKFYPKTLLKQYFSNFVRSNPNRVFDPKEKCERDEQ